MPTISVMHEINEAIDENRRTLPVTPRVSFETLAQDQAVLMLEAEERITELSGATDDPLCAKLRQAVHRTRHLRHTVERHTLSERASHAITLMRRRCVEAGQAGCEVQSSESAQAEELVRDLVVEMETELQQLRAALALAESKLVEKSRELVAVAS